VYYDPEIDQVSELESSIGRDKDWQPRKNGRAFKHPHIAVVAEDERAYQNG